jgi:hypothetical protein
MLTIDRLATRAAIPRRLIGHRGVIERTTHEDFPTECGRQFKRKWHSQKTVTRIRQLHVKVSLPAKDLRPDALASAWTVALLQELFASLTRSSNAEILHFETRTHYLVAAIHDCLNGVTAQRWAYEELEFLFKGDPAPAVLHLLARELTEIVPVLLLLDDLGLLDRLVTDWSESDLRQLFQLLSAEGDSRANEPSIDDLVSVGQLVLADKVVRGKLRTMESSGFALGKIALRLFLRSVRGSRSRAASGIGPKVIFRVVSTLRALLDFVDGAGLWRPSNSSSDFYRPLFMGDRSDEHNAVVSEQNIQAFCELLVNRGLASESAVSQPVRELQTILSISDSTDRSAFLNVFAELVATSSSRISRHGRTTTKSTNFAGLFLLVRMINWLDWEEQLARSQLGSRYGPRLLTYTLAGVGLAILDRFVEAPDYLDPGLALFAGWIEEPDLGGLGWFLNSTSTEERLNLLPALLGKEATDSAEASWQSCFEALAAHLIQEFGVNLRYFREPSRAFIVRNFIALPGYIRVEDQRMTVNFSSNPLQIVSHLSGLEDPVEIVSWLGGRSVYFQTEGV